jgi:PAS domain S-box-containing protein
MPDEDPELKRRLAETEATIDALRRQEVDAVVGADQVMLLRLREVEQQLRESEQRFRVLVDAIAEAIWETDAEGRVVEESATWLQYTGQAPGASLGEGWIEAIDPRDREAFRAQWKEALRGENVLDAEFRLGVTGDQPRWSHARAAPLPDAQGRVVKWVGMIIDISRRKASEQSLQQARDQAEAASRARGHFLANMSHEIRTPMTAILGYADILRESLSDPDDLHCIDTIRRNGDFLLSLINDILDLSKIDAGQLAIDPDQVELDTLLVGLRSLMQVRADERGLDLRIRFDGPVPRVIETDRTRVRQVLVNLLGNAIKFTEKGSVELAIRYLPGTQQLQFDVIDTGIGIEETELERLFEPFIQADSSTTRNFGGTGLGLAISRRMAQALGGNITARSQPGRGSTFTLTIACGPHTDPESVQLSGQSDPDPADPDPDVKTESSQRPRLRGRILVVDDQPDIRFLAEKIIRGAGVEVTTTHNGAEAIELLSNAAEDQPGFDLVVMDMHMPVLDGMKATQQLRQQGFGKPIIALTADAMAGDRERYLDAGCTDYASKPLNARQLLETIGRYL